MCKLSVYFDCEKGLEKVDDISIKDSMVRVQVAKNLIKTQEIWKEKLSILKKYDLKTNQEPSFFYIDKEGFKDTLDISKLNPLPFGLIDASKVNIIVSFYKKIDQPSQPSLLPTKLPEEVFLFSENEGGLSRQPFLFPTGWWTCDCIYVLSCTTTNNVSNEIFYLDMQSACESISKHKNRELQLCPIQAADFGITSESSFQNDAFVQDQFIIGFIGGSSNTIKKVAFNYRAYKDRSIKDFIKQLNTKGLTAVSERIVSLIDEFKDDMESPFNFGGNIMISPPVTEATLKISKNAAAGPTVPPHPKAPFGKIIVGDSETGSIAKILRIFLTSQKIQPVLPVDTSWLLVGHVDEFLSFVPHLEDSREQFKALYADPELMIFMLEEIQKVSETRQTNFFRGKYYKDDVVLYEKSLKDMLETDKNLISYNKKLKTQKLNPIKERLQQGLKMHEKDFVSMPVVFYTKPEVSSSYKTSAQTVNIVNLQYVNGHILLPQPFGPRLSIDLAKNVVIKSLGKAGLNIIDVAEYPENQGFWAWQPRFTSLTDIAMSYLLYTDNNGTEEPLSVGGVGKIISCLKSIFRESNKKSRIELRKKCLESLDKPIQVGIENLQNKIQGDTKNRGKFSNSILDGDIVVQKTCKIWIQEETVDVIELYIYTIFKSLLGVPETNIHFIDDWIYHLSHGEVHCGTVAERTLDSSVVDWGKYSEVMKDMNQYSFSYDPKQ